MIRGNGGKAAHRLKVLLGSGFETYQIHWWAETGNENLEETSREIADLPTDDGVSEISALALYGNPLRTDAEGERARSSIRKLIASAELFGCTIVGLFTGRIPGRLWEDSLPRFSEVFDDLCRRAAASGVTLALENCAMGGNHTSGDWNMAFGPKDWTRLFESLSPGAADALGLEWEPAHQIDFGNPPLTQLSGWVNKIVHVHGKDALTEESGEIVHCLPGRGQTDWAEVFEILKQAGFRGSVDIEGYHDPEWKGDREIPGQIRSLNYLKKCRDGQRSSGKWLEEGVSL